MYVIKVHSEDESLLEYLSYEGTKKEESSFEFSSVKRVAEVLSRYIYFSIKNDAISRIFPGVDAFDSDIESFLMFLPYDYEEMWKNRVEEMVDMYLESERVNEFYIDGFITFRMSDIKKKYYDYLEMEYGHFVEAIEPTESLEALIDFMHSQNVKAEELIIETKENGHIVIKEEGIPLYMETENEQENIVVQSVYASPRKVKILDEYNILRKELVIVLKQIFGKNLFFEHVVSDNHS